MDKVLAAVLCFAAIFGAASAGSCGHESCPDNFVLLDGRCINITTNSRWKWEDARTLCKSMASGNWTTDLADLNTDFLKSFNHFIAEQSSMSYTAFWVGAKYINGIWQWMDGSPIDVMSYVWHLSYPYHGNSPCGLLVPSYEHGRHYLLGEYTSDRPAGSLCEARLSIGNK